MPGIGCFSSHNAVFAMRSVRSSSSLFCAAASVSCDGDAVTDSTRETTSATMLSCPDTCCMSVVNWPMKSRRLNCCGEHLSHFCWKV
jgi:hypothetical protein